MDTFRKVKVAERDSHDRQLSQRGSEEATTDSECEGSTTPKLYYSSYTDIINSFCLFTVILISSFGSEQFIRVGFPQLALGIQKAGIEPELVVKCLFEVNVKT